MIKSESLLRQVSSNQLYSHSLLHHFHMNFLCLSTNLVGLKISNMDLQSSSFSLSYVSYAIDHSTSLAFWRNFSLQGQKSAPNFHLQSRGCWYLVRNCSSYLRGNQVKPSLQSLQGVANNSAGPIVLKILFFTFKHYCDLYL